MNIFKRKKHGKSRKITSLPQDIVVEITSHLASHSSQPLDDIKNLRAVCKTFHDASKTKKVGKSMCIYNEWSKFWHDKPGWRVYLTFCARSGNFQAQSILGMDCIYAGEQLLGVDYLIQACLQGHLTSAYILGVHCFNDPRTREYAIRLLNCISSGDLFEDVDHYSNNQNVISGNVYIHKCRREGKEILHRLTFTRFSGMQKEPCENQSCGHVVMGSNRWMPNDEIPRRFCSEYCLWNDECYIFFNNNYY